MNETTVNGIKFTDTDIVNPDDMIPAGESNPHNVHGFLFHDHGFAIAVAFADCLQDALDIAADADKLKCYAIDVESSERDDYLTPNVADIAAGFDAECPEYVFDGIPYWWKVEPAFLGNASDPFDIESLGVIELPAPTMSICRLYGETINSQHGRS